MRNFKFGRELFCVFASRCSAISIPALTRAASRLGRLKALIAGAMFVMSVAGIAAGAPLYNIVDIGIVNVTDTASQGFRISPNGIATGRSYGNPFSASSQVYSWTQGGGIAGLPNIVFTTPARPHAAGNGANDAGVVVGAQGATASLANPLPIMWQGGVASQIPLPAGQTFGSANDINSSSTIVGSVNGGSSQIAMVSSGGTSSVVSTLTPGGAYTNVLFSINNAGIAVGSGIDPNNAARNVGFVYDTVNNTASEVPPLAGKNGAIAFDVSEAGAIVGVSMQNQGTGTAFYWSQSTGSVAIPLVAGTSSNSARGVNSAGWVVGNAGGAFSVPWLWDGTQSYRLQDLIPANSGWDLSHNTSNSAMGISEAGIIVGTGVHGSDTHAYAMIPVVPEPAALGALAVGWLVVMRRRARRVAAAARNVSTRAVCASAIAAAAGAAPTVAHAAGMFETVIKSSDPVPGVAGATWNTTSNSFFSAGAIDEAGNVVFRGQMTAGVGGVQSTSPTNQAGYWYGAPGLLNLVARDGVAGPTLANPNNWVHNSTSGLAGLTPSAPNISPNGTILATSQLNGSGAASTNNTAAWTGSYNNMQMVAQRGVTSGPQPSGTTHAMWNSAMNFISASRAVNNAGQIVIGSNLITDGDAGTDVIGGTWSAGNLTNDGGIWVGSPAGNTLIAREGASTPIAGTIFGEVTLAANTAALNHLGQVAFIAPLRGTVGGVVSSGGSGLNDQVVWTNAVSGGAITPIARKGDPVPGLGGVNYASSGASAFSLGAVPLNNSGRLVFEAQFNTGAATGTANEALMTSHNGGTNVVVRATDPAAGVAGATWDSFNQNNSQFRLNNNNSLVFGATMLGTPNGSADNEGMWKTTIDASGAATNTQLIAQKGQAIPNTAGLNLGGGLVNASQALLNNADQLVFMGTVTGAGVTTSNDQAVFQWSQGDGLQMLLREGDLAAASVSGLTGTFGNTNPIINPFSFGITSNGEGGNVSLTDNGWLTLAVTLQGNGITNDINIIRTQVPEPSSLCMIGAGILLATKRRRRR